MQPDPTVTPEPSATPPPSTATPEPSATAVPSVTPEPEPVCRRVSDFATEAEHAAWFVVNDNVMGGRSSGGPVFANGAMTFAGDINTNGGGFSSVRMPITPGDFADYTHLMIRARTDGRPYKITVEDGLETRDRRVSFQAPMNFVDEDADEWQLARVDFADLTSRIFGREVDTDPFRPDLADQLGIMLSDNVDGAFRLEVDWIDVCRAP